MTVPTIGRGQVPVSSPVGATLSIANGQVAVAFTGTAFVSTDPSTKAPAYAVGVGDILVVAGIGFGIIESVQDATHLTLAAPWEAATQSSITSGGSPGWYIIRSSVSAFGPVAKAIQDVTTRGSDDFPMRSWTIDDGGARLKFRVVGGIPQIAVGPSGTDDANLKASISFNPTTGQITFPSGTGTAGGGTGGAGGGGTGGGGTGGGGGAGPGSTATLNPADADPAVVVGTGNLSASWASTYGAHVGIRGNTAGQPGNYFEAVFTFSGGSDFAIGVANLVQSLSTGYPGDPNADAWFGGSYAEWPGSGFSNAWVTINSGAVIGVQYTGTQVKFTQNGTLVGTATAVPGGSLYPIFTSRVPLSVNVNFGATAFSYPPSGASGWGQGAASGTTSTATWSPTNKDPSVSLSNVNLTATGGADLKVVKSTVAGNPNNYFELVWSSGPDGFGLANASEALNAGLGRSGSNSICFFANGYVGFNGAFTGYGYSIAPGDVMGLLLGSSDIKLYKGGSLLATVTDRPTGALFAAVEINTGNVATANFGAAAFTTPPTGATGWGT